MTVGVEVGDIGLAGEGRRRIESAARELPVLHGLRAEVAATRPLDGVRVAACLPVTAATGVLMLSLSEAGADVALCASDPSLTDDAVAAALADGGIGVRAVRGESPDDAHRRLVAVVDERPQVALDAASDLLGVLHASRRGLLDQVLAVLADGEAGALRARELERAGDLGVPVIAVGEAETAKLVDSRFGSGRAVIDQLERVLGGALDGREVVVAGYGWHGRGIADRARAVGARVTVLEIDPLRALQAAMDGHAVATAQDAARLGDVFITATGGIGVLGPEQVALMRDGAVLCNAGSYALEIEGPALRESALGIREPRLHLETLELADGRSVGLVAGGGPIAALGSGAPLVVLDVRLAAHLLCAAYAVAHGDALDARVYVAPPEVDGDVARRPLAALGHAIDEPTEDQRRYAAGWRDGA
jgi:adenosylhomocysteinase